MIGFFPTKSKLAFERFRETTKSVGLASFLVMGYLYKSDFYYLYQLLISDILGPFRNPYYYGRIVYILLGTPLIVTFLIAVVLSAVVTYLSLSKPSKKKSKRLEGPQRVSPYQLIKRYPSKGADVEVAFFASLTENRFAQIANKILPILTKRVKVIPNSIGLTPELTKTHTILLGDSGQGKSTVMHHMLLDLRKRGEKRVVIFDPEGEFAQSHYQEGDVLLNPLLEGCPFWDIIVDLGTEQEHKFAAHEIASNLLPSGQETGNQFFQNASLRFLTSLLQRLAREKKDFTTLLEWLSDPKELQDTVAYTPVAQLVAGGEHASGQRQGIFGSLVKITDCLTLLPPNDGRTTLSVNQWIQKPSGWIFVGGKRRYNETLLPFFHLMLGLLINRMMDDSLVSKEEKKWLFVDEFPLLHYMPSLRDALTGSRKYGLRLILGCQGIAQVNQYYDKSAATMLSMPKVRFYFRTEGGESALSIAKDIGVAKFEKQREGYTESTKDHRDSLNRQVEEKVDFAVQPYEVSGLKTCWAFVRIGDVFSKIHIPFPRLKARAVYFKPREVTTPHKKTLEKGKMSKKMAIGLPKK